jgi:hypothetical protein
MNGRFKTWSDGHNPGLNNPALVCSSVSHADQSVSTEIHEAYPQIDQTYFGAPALQGVMYPLFEFMMRPTQDAMAWFCTLDVSQPAGPAQVIRCRNDWDTYPVRWLGSHGTESIDTPQSPKSTTTADLLRYPTSFSIRRLVSNSGFPTLLGLRKGQQAKIAFGSMSRTSLWQRRLPHGI